MGPHATRPCYYILLHVANFCYYVFVCSSKSKRGLTGTFNGSVCVCVLHFVLCLYISARVVCGFVCASYRYRRVCVACMYVCVYVCKCVSVYDYRAALETPTEAARPDRKAGRSHQESKSVCDCETALETLAEAAGYNREGTQAGEVPRNHKVELEHNLPFGHLEALGVFSAMRCENFEPVSALVVVQH